MDKKSLKMFLPAILILVVVVSVYNLVKQQEGLTIKRQLVNETPTFIFTPKQSQSDILVFMAHGFGGSASLMKSLAVSLSKTGHKTITFDFLGHGRHPRPYSGDITIETGATKLFVKQINNIICYYLDEENFSRAVIIGHSMASDLIFRAAFLNKNVVGAIGLSNYTDIITGKEPSNVLIVNGMWEPSLRSKAFAIMESLGIENPQEDKIYGSFADNSARKITSVSKVGHVGILYSSKTQKEVNNWINNITSASRKVVTSNIGTWVLALFVSLFFLFLIFVQHISKREQKKINVKFKNCLLGNLIALILTPLLLSIYSTNLIPFVSHNYLVNHLFLYSIIAFLCTQGSITYLSFGGFNLAIFTGLVVFFLLILGAILDQYVSSFYLSTARVPIFFILLIGSIPITFYVQLFYQDPSAGLWKATLTKFSLLLSFAFPIILNFRELFLLGYALLLLCAFWFIFSPLSHLLLRRIGSNMSVALANGVALSWTFSTAIPLYVP